MQQRLAHPHIGHQRVIRAEADAVVHASGRGGVDMIPLFGGLFFVIGLHLADKVGLSGQQRADANAVFRGHQVGNAIKVRRALLGEVFRPPGIVFPRLKVNFAAQLFVFHHKWTRADDMAGIAQFLKVTL